MTAISIDIAFAHEMFNMSIKSRKQEHSHSRRFNDGSFPTTPTKTSNDNEQRNSAEQCATPETPTPTLRERRGRRNTPGSSYRPLSVFTKSLLIPFNFDADRAFNMIKSSDDTPISTSQTPHRRRFISTSEQRATRKKHLNASHSSPLSISSNAAALGELPFSKGPSMDLLTALRTTSPDKNCSNSISTDYPTLIEASAPDFKDHPVFSSSPFTSSSKSPLFVTSSSPEEIRRIGNDNKKSSESAGKASNNRIYGYNLEKKKSIFGLDVKTPVSLYRKRRSDPIGGSPPTQRSVSKSPIQANGVIESSSSGIEDLDFSRKSASSSSSSGGIRKFSDIFKSRISAEKQRTPPAPSNICYSLESPNLERQDLELFLRRTTFSPTYDYSPSDAFPRHPNTGRGWRSRNLKCTTCTEESCACCRRCCCAYKAAVSALDTHKEGSPSREDALLRIQEITKLFPYGNEAPTFLQCTRGVEADGGCGKMICPDCCSICPDEACGDTQCKTCKPTMWEECNWHRGKASANGDILPIRCSVKI